MASRIKAYPWSETKGLCKILQDPFVWSTSFPGLEARQMVKDAAKKVQPSRNVRQVRVFKVTDDEKFGTVVIELLASQAGRKALGKVFSNRFDESRLNASIAKRLYEHHLEKHANKLPNSDQLLDKNRNNSQHFVAERFATWLEQKKLSPEDQRILSLYRDPK